MVYKKTIKAQNAPDWHRLYADLYGIVGQDPVFAMVEVLVNEYDLPRKFQIDVEKRFVWLEKYRKVEEIYRNFFNSVKDIPHSELREACHECLAKIKELVNL